MEVLLSLLAGKGPFVESLHETAIETDRLAAIQDCGVEVIIGPAREAPLVEGVGIVRNQANGLAVILFRAVEVALAQTRIALLYPPPSAALGVQPMTPVTKCGE